MEASILSVEVLLNSFVRLSAVHASRGVRVKPFGVSACPPYMGSRPLPQVKPAQPLLMSLGHIVYVSIKSVSIYTYCLSIAWSGLDTSCITPLVDCKGSDQNKLGHFANLT